MCNFLYWLDFRAGLSNWGCAAPAGKPGGRGSHYPGDRGGSPGGVPFRVAISAKHNAPGTSGGHAVIPVCRSYPVVTPALFLAPGRPDSGLLIRCSTQ
jgi:hypothetical protein